MRAASRSRLESAGVSVHVDDIPYPAVSVQTLVDDSVNGRKRFFDSLDTGTYMTVNRVTLEARNCPSQQIVLIGWSQGAMAVQAATNHKNFVGSRVAAVGLVASGDRLGTWGRIVEKGTATPGAGVRQGMLGTRPKPPCDRAPAPHTSKPLRRDGLRLRATSGWQRRWAPASYLVSTRPTPPSRLRGFGVRSTSYQGVAGQRFGRCAGRPSATCRTVFAPRDDVTVRGWVGEPVEVQLTARS